ncbi:MAG: carbohydrate ABC transporter permease [Candidatus Cloacimonetes bacterium]|nr:carbohydrate ABC transporter permease [Candidatus Cloacimonadota bacterium]MBL7086320.1 carbohydrate ABC transporter permease [Candidatus Cloacimonadota bacterium]
MVKKIFGKGITYFLLIICGLVMVVPFLWMVSTSLKSQTDINRGSVGFIPYSSITYYHNNGKKEKVEIVTQDRESSVINIYDEEGKTFKQSFVKVPTSSLTTEKRIRFNFNNFSEAFNKVPFGRYFLNTIFVSFCVLLGVLISSSLAAYAFARMQFKGRDFIFYLFISMMMVPQPIYLIPSYYLLTKIGWINTYYALIIPWIANIFSIFLLRQQFKTIPQDLFDAAVIDGCSRFSILWRIILPISKPVLATAAIFSIIGSWNSFMWPLVMTSSEHLRVLQVGLSYFAQESSSHTALLMSASTFSIAPLLILFLFAQRQIISSFITSGLKG